MVVRNVTLFKFQISFSEIVESSVLRKQQQHQNDEMKAKFSSFRFLHLVQVCTSKELPTYLPTQKDLPYAASDIVQANFGSFSVSVTIFIEILPLWQTCKSLWPFFQGFII